MDRIDLRIVIAVICLTGCDDSVRVVDRGAEQTPAELSVLVTGGSISGANGLHFSPAGDLYVASVLGSEIVVLNPATGEVIEHLRDGVDGPDDVAFAPVGAFYWTSILTGEVAGITADGERITAAILSPGVNPLTFSDSGRLFVAQCFFGANLYEVDPAGREPARLISDELGPACGLNGMDWGPDGRLYGPRWFHQQVVSFDVDTGEMRIEATGFNVPAAVKFNSKGELHVLDTGADAVIRVIGLTQHVVAKLVPGLDNLAFDSSDRLFVSSYADGAVLRVEDDGTLTELVTGGMAHPGGITAVTRGGVTELVVADLHSIRGFDAHSGDSTFTQRNILGMGALGSALAVAADGENLILTAWTDNNVRVWDPIAETTLERYDNLSQPVSAVRYAGGIAVAEHAGGRVRLIGGERSVVFAEGLNAPTALLTDGDRLWVSDRNDGRVLLIARSGEPIEPVVIAEGVAYPEGLALWGDEVLVLEGETGNVLAINDGSVRRLVTVGGGSPAASAAQPPSMIFNDIVVVGNILYATDELKRQIYAVTLN